MLHFIQRHVRYILLVLAIFTLVLFFVTPEDFPDAFSSIGASPAKPTTTTTTTRSSEGLASDPNLSRRLARSERTYQDMLQRRQGLIAKHGPNASQVLMFPPDEAPWPPYTAWDFFPPVFDCPHELERLGATGDGGKWTCGLSRLEDKPGCVIYSFGIDWDSSWEAEVLARTEHCEIWGFDYTQEGFGPDVRSMKHRTHFQQLQLGPTNSHGPDDDPKVYTLQSIMLENGHSHIDILNIDLEGWEFQTLRAMIGFANGTRTPLPFGQLLLEIHAWNQRFEDFLHWFEQLEIAGLRPFMSEPNLIYQNYNRQSGPELVDYSFLNLRGENMFTTDRRPQFHSHAEYSKDQ